MCLYFFRLPSDDPLQQFWYPWIALTLCYPNILKLLLYYATEPPPPPPLVTILASIAGEGMKDTREFAG